jgi:serine/threonine-protein kinase
VTRRDRAAYRRAAELIAEAAEALEHAHALGVVHRDVKPANLLLDGQGKLWVTDFGLARLGTDAGVTLTGDLLGTLRYMSPEQAMARHGLVDHRTDVYALGATLYELLTLQPAVDGRDREEILRHIMFEEPRPPRRLDRGVPVELETIVLKALEKNPAERYATAQELAADLRRWLEDRPIRARRPSWWQTAARWARRHRPLVGAVTAVVLLAVLLVGGNGLWWLQQRAVAEGQARIALDEAKQRLEQEQWPEMLTAVRRAEGAIAGVGAAPDLRREIDELGKDAQMALKLQEARLRHAEYKEGDWDREGAVAAYAEAFRWYGLDLDRLDPREATERIRACSIRLPLAAALDHWAYLPGTVRDQTWRQLVMMARAADPDPWRLRLRDALEAGNRRVLEELVRSARADQLTPMTAVHLASFSLGTAAAEPALLLLQQVRQQHPGDFWANHDLGAFLGGLRPPRSDEALCYLTAAVALRPQSPGARINLGRALGDKGRLDEAIAEYREALRLEPDLAIAHYSLGHVLHNKGQLDEAIAAYRAAIHLKKDYTWAHNNLGLALKEKGQLDEAIAAFRAAIHLKKDDALAHNNLGLVLQEKGQLDEAIAAFRAALRLEPDLAIAHNNLACALNVKGQLDEAIAALREAVRLRPEFAEAHSNLGQFLRKKGHLEEAIAECREALRLKPDFAKAHHNLGNALLEKGQRDEAIAAHREALRLKPDYASAHLNLGNALLEKGQRDEAIAAYREALRLKPDFPEAHHNLGRALQEKGQFADALAALRRAEELGRKTPGWRSTLDASIKECERLVELDARLPALFKGEAKPADTVERLTLAGICQTDAKQLFAASARWYAEAFAAEPRLAGAQPSEYRYNAACAAALAGCGQGKDAAGLDAKERARLRLWALDWLKRELQAWQRALEQAPDQAGPAAGKQLQHWLQDPDFSGLRDAQALARLPVAERQKWQQLWADIAATLARSQGQAAPPPKSAAK